ncbi:hypothetical protein [Nocardioides sp. 616]|uniref:hypothetical protein n=1 Tax=Nocardioides sp. 616 TaxID=2268090 RepID=UPI000CE3C497|nr:hypothetical protein [Nocardioides sp. 616]
MQMPHRRGTALVSLALILAPVLSSCGFDHATDRDYTPGVGANHRSGEVDVLGGVIVTAEGGEGVLIAGLSNNSTKDEVTLDEVLGDEPGFTVEGLEPVVLPPKGFANLAKSETPIMISGDFAPGDFVEVTFSFSNGEQATVNIPSRLNCGDYADVPGVPAGDPTCSVETPESH